MAGDGLYVIMPNGALGASSDDSLLDRVLRTIAVQASDDPAGEWAEKYGTNYENSTFMMHKFCYCERPDCPWCGWCQCEGEEPGHASREEDRCDFCVGRGVFAARGAEPGRRAPNFWHKPSGLKIWWYKYIGRDMELNRSVTAQELLQIQTDCLGSLKQQPGKVE